MLTLFTLLVWFHCTLALIFSIKHLVAMPALWGTFVQALVDRGHPSGLGAAISPLTTKAFSALVTWVMISLLGFLGAVYPFWGREKVRFFLLYTQEDLDKRIIRLIERLEQRNLI